jgi:hypothetical protein
MKIQNYYQSRAEKDAAEKSLQDSLPAEDIHTVAASEDAAATKV